MSLQPVEYPGLPKRLTLNVRDPQPGEPADDLNRLDDALQAVIGLANALVSAAREVGGLRWEKVDARASAGRAAALRGDPALLSKYGPARVVEWGIDPDQALPTNFWEGGRVEGGVTYPGDYAIVLEPAT